jgi:hypothetical protein
VTRYDSLRIGNRILWRALAILGLVFAGMGLSGILSEWVVSVGIEWVSVTNLGMLVTGLWVILSAGVAELLTDRVFRQLAKNES